MHGSASLETRRASEAVWLVEIDDLIQRHGALNAVFPNFDEADIERNASMFHDLESRDLRSLGNELLAINDVRESVLMNGVL